MRECVFKLPEDCSAQELAEFEELAVTAGKVASNGLPELMQAARLLAFLRHDGKLVGVAGLKRPRKSYRERVAQNSGVDLPLAAYPFELGWVSSLEEGGPGKSRALCEPMMVATPGYSVFATTGVENEKMQSTLRNLGFEPVGDTWKSSEGDETLCLFTCVRKRAD